MANQTPRRFAAALVGVVCAFSTVDNALAQCQYEVTAIINGPLCWGSALPLTGTGMNQLGHVTGSHWDCSQSSHDHGFFWTPRTGRVTMHKPPGVWRVNPTDINDAGLIVGTMQITGIGGQGFVYDMHTQQYLAVLPPLHDGLPALNIVSTINAINNAGIAVGARVISKPGVVPAVSNAVIWNTNTGEVIDLGVMKGPNSSASGINSVGVAVGWTGQSSTSPDSAFEFFEKPHLLGPIPDGTNSVGVAVNDSNIVLGQGRMALPNDTSIHAFMWRDGFLATVGPPDGIVNIGGGDINNVGQMALTGTITGGDALPFLWQHEVLHSLADLLGDGTDVISGRASAMAINDAGQILIRSANTRAAILAPIGQPLGDLNHDCRVDVHDLHILLDAWGSTGTRGQSKSPADLNGDGVVDVSDLLILLANWSPPERR